MSSPQQSSDEILNDLRDVFNKFAGLSNYTSERVKRVNEQIFLDKKTCPRGLSACDPSLGDCPSDDVAIQPEMYTSDGLRCYTDVNMAKVRSRSPLEKREQQTQLMTLVEQSAKLVAAVQGKLKDVSCNSIESENLCGMKDTCNWANGVCSTSA